MPHEIDEYMKKRLWGKFMLNVGVNQAVAAHGSCYGDIHKEGFAREVMIKAMREVIPIADIEGIQLCENDVQYWLKVVDALSPEGKPSLQQDLEAGRPTEVELFSGTVLRLGHKYNIETPVNKALYEQIKSSEGDSQSLYLN